VRSGPQKDLPERPTGTAAECTAIEEPGADCVAEEYPRMKVRLNAPRLRRDRIAFSNFALLGRNVERSRSRSNSAALCLAVSRGIRRAGPKDIPVISASGNFDMLAVVGPRFRGFPGRPELPPRAGLPSRASLNEQAAAAGQARYRGLRERRRESRKLDVAWSTRVLGLLLP
jgi:hypothetical protein